MPALKENSTEGPRSKTDYENDPKFKWFLELRRNCFLRNSSNSGVLEEQYKDDGVRCPRTLDVFACWDETPSSTTAVQPCPGFVVGFDPKRFAYKKCTENGTWYINPVTNKEYTNYTSCVDIEDLDFRTIVNIMYVVGYSISAVALVLALMIFLYFRTLHCTRIRIHMHLFSAFAVNNILWITWYRAVIENVTVVQENGEWCQWLHIINHYFMVATYFWMFCEGLHLHIALVVVFLTDEIAMRWFVALGWVVSLVITTVYATTRYYTPGATERCWIDYSDTIWIIAVPVGFSLLISFVFLINVVRVLVTKLHPPPNQQSCAAAKKAVRATLVLIPLFGLHFVLIPLRPLPESPWEKVYQVGSAILTSLQGLCVATLFCFTNNEVITAIKATISRHRRINEALALTGSGNTFPLTGIYRR